MKKQNLQIDHQLCLSTQASNVAEARFKSGWLKKITVLCSLSLYCKEHSSAPYPVHYADNDGCNVFKYLSAVLCETSSCSDIFIKLCDIWGYRK